MQRTSEQASSDLIIGISAEGWERWGSLEFERNMIPRIGPAISNMPGCRYRSQAGYCATGRQTASGLPITQTPAIGSSFQPLPFPSAAECRWACRQRGINPKNLNKRISVQPQNMAQAHHYQAQITEISGEYGQQIRLKKFAQIAVDRAGWLVQYSQQRNGLRRLTCRPFPLGCALSW